MITNQDIQNMLEPLDYVVQINDNPHRGTQVRFCPHEEARKTHRYCASIVIDFINYTCTVTNAPSVFPNTECNVLEACDVYTRIANFIREISFAQKY